MNDSRQEPLEAAVPIQSKTRTIAGNSLWTALDLGFSYFTVLATSIPIARIVGPEQLGYFTYIFFLTRISALIGTMGAASTARKYMAEYLGRGQGPIARAIFETAIRFQVVPACVVTLTGLVLVFTVSDPAYRIVSAILVLGMLPTIMYGLPSHANLAKENMAANVMCSVSSGFLYVLLVILSLSLGWGLKGVALAVLISRTLEFVLKMISVRRWISTFSRVPLPPELRQRMISFSGQSLVLMLVQLIVWDRSDVFFLKNLTTEISQVAFYSVAISLADQASQVPAAFSSGIGMTLMVEYGRGEKGLRSVTALAIRYLLLIACPLLLGLSVMSGPAIRVLYGAQYLASIPVLALAALFALPKALASPANLVLVASEKQPFLIRWFVLCATANILLDIALIPRFGALGAAVANGTAQTLAVLGIWTRVWTLLDLQVDLPSLGKIGASAVFMAVAVSPIVLSLSPWVAAITGPVFGALVYFLSLRWTRALHAEDEKRLLQLGSFAPGPLRSWFGGFVRSLVPRQAGASQNP